MTTPCTCDLTRCVPCDEARDAELRRTFGDGEKSPAQMYHEALLARTDQLWAEFWGWDEDRE